MTVAYFLLSIRVVRKDQSYINFLSAGMPHKPRDPKPLDTKIRHDDWRDDLFKHGYVVVKGVIEPKKAQRYMESMFAWLEKFPLGFDRNNRSTWTVDHLPAHMKSVETTQSRSSLIARIEVACITGMQSNTKTSFGKQECE